MNPALKAFVGLLDTELSADGFVRRGPAFRRFAPGGNGIVVQIQRTFALEGDVAFFVNVGVLLGSHLEFSMGGDDPRLDSMPMHGIWEHRLVASPERSDHTFSLTTTRDADRAFAVVHAWLAATMPRLLSWMSTDAMLAGRRADQAQNERALDEPILSRRSTMRPEGHWNTGVLAAYVCAERGDVDAVVAAIDGWHGAGKPDSMAAHVFALAERRAAELAAVGEV